MFYRVSSLFMLAASTAAFSPMASNTNNRIAFQGSSKASNTMLYNVPPPSTEGDPAAVKDVADREGPPQSFYQLQLNCARAAELAIRDGYKLIEVEVRLMCVVLYHLSYDIYM